MTTRPTGQWPSCLAVKSATGFITLATDVLRIRANKNTERGKVCQVGDERKCSPPWPPALIFEGPIFNPPKGFPAIHTPCRNIERSLPHRNTENTLNNSIQAWDLKKKKKVWQPWEGWGLLDCCFRWEQWGSRGFGNLPQIAGRMRWNQERGGSVWSNPFRQTTSLHRGQLLSGCLAADFLKFFFISEPGVTHTHFVRDCPSNGAAPACHQRVSGA